MTRRCGCWRSGCCFGRRPERRLSGDRTGGVLRCRAGEDWPEEPAVMIVTSVGAEPGKSGLIVGGWMLLRIAPEAGQKRLAGRADGMGKRAFRPSITQPGRAGIPTGSAERRCRAQ
ncbi:hypothetical protein Droror1_Dr00024466, partial [Drosera rotundifolia]